MTNHVIDFKNSDSILVMGSNVAENHPVSMRWINKAREERGAKMIHVDPRFTRTSAVSDIYAPLRPGTDIAFLGGMIKYIIDNNLMHRDYVVNFTNASWLVNDAYAFDPETGFFSGWDAEKKKYDTTTWDYQYGPDGTTALKDPTLNHPRCVFQLMKKHYGERYDIDTVINITGTPRDQYLQVLNEYCSTGAPNKTGVIVYAMGITQHTVGAQNVRAFGIVQLLLGNMGRPGGGIAAMRGENNVQGATDMALLFGNLPGYIDSPTNIPAYKDLTSYIKKATPGAAKLPATNLDELAPLLAAGVPMSGFRVNTSKWITSTLKAWWGDKATKANDYGYAYLPKREDTKNYSHMAMFEEMAKGAIDGLFIMGGNPVVGGPNANKEQYGLTKLKWMVSVDLWLNETAEFWSYEGLKRGADKPIMVGEEVKQLPKSPTEVETEVFFLPACGVYEKEGTAAQTGRWVQYRWKGADPLGESKPDLWIIDQLAQRIKKLYETSTKVEDEPIKYLTWGYTEEDALPKASGYVSTIGEEKEPLPVKVGFELNGYNTTTGKAILGGFANLKDDGSTACGNWIYCGCWEEDPAKLQPDKDGVKQNYKPMWRNNKDNSKTNLGLFSNWGWCWPVNRRILYNRCSVQMDGLTAWPGDDDRVLIRWDEAGIADPKKPEVKGVWGGKGYDVPDCKKDGGPAAVPYLMRPEGYGCFFSFKSTMKDGPFPEHYEPWESPVANLLNKKDVNPAAKVWEPKNKGEAKDYPCVLTTYRTVEHWQTGALTRNLPWLAELMPNMIVEISEELASLEGIENGGKVIVSSVRGEIEAYALVTKRIKPLVVNGDPVHMVGALWCYGYNGFAKGDPINRLTPHIGDANTMTPEYKASLCSIRRAE